MNDTRTPDEWAEIEAKEHDEYYRGAFPFGLRDYKFSKEHVLWFEDYAFKKGRRKDRGHRTKKFLELVNLDELNGKRVLDIGCGIGQYSVLYAKCGASCTGVELSPVACEIARKIAEANNVGASCTFMPGDFVKLNLPENYYDVVTLHEVLHHAIKYPGVKEMVYRVTKPGGKIVVADTVRGAGVIHLGRKAVKFFRHLGNRAQKIHEENLGDVLFSVETYEQFAVGSSYYKIYPMSFFYMVKQTALKHHTNRLPVRIFLRAAKYCDDVLLTVFPFMKRYCGEAVLYIEK